MAAPANNSRLKPRHQGIGRTRYVWVVLAALVAIFQSHPIGAEPPKEVRRILILNEVGTSYPAIPIINEGIQTALNDSPYHLEFYSEYMDTVLFPDPGVQQEFRDFYLRKYHDRKPDVIITVGASPLKFMQEVHQTAFPGVPIVFCLPNRGLPGSPVLDPDFTGVENDMAPAKTLEIALRLQPGTEHVVVVGGVSDWDKQEEENARQQLKEFTNHLDITFMSDLAMPDLLERLRHLPAHTLILFTSVSMDATGRRFKSNETGPMVSAAANAPIFSLFDVYINHGEVGGYLSSLSQQGNVAGGMALRTLMGAKPQDIPRVRGVNAYIFDWRALKRWGLRESALPPGSTLLFREDSVWERTKRIWIGGLLIILFLSGLAAYLQFSRKQLKQARDAQLRLSGLLINAQERERSRLASELHDDFSQRLALLALELENASEELPDSSAATKQQLHKLLNSASELGADLHTVSHRLHPSTLESLGLVRGLKALCEEFTSRQGIEIVFSPKNVPTAVPSNVALCLFRVAQEGLQNLRKYSGASQGQVNLHKAGANLFLSVSDNGCGFDAKEMMNREGLGIRSMGERARLVGGQFEIHSKPGKGTTIDVCVPLQPENETAKELDLQWKADIL